MTSSTIDLAELIPALADVRAGRARLAEYRASTPPPQPPHELAAQLSQQLATAAEAGDPLPDDLAATITAARQQTETHTIVTQALISAEQILKQREDDAVRAGADEALGTLAGRLTELLAAVRDIAPALGKVRTAEEAMDAGPAARDAYPIGRDLLRQYTALRTAQGRLTRAAWGGDPRSATGILRDAGEFANIDSMWPCWLKALTGNTYLDERNNTYTPTPWPDDADPFKNEYSVADLTWIARPDGPARPGIPTVSELREAYEAQHTAAQKRERLAEQRAGLGHQSVEYMPGIR